MDLNFVSPSTPVSKKGLLNGDAAAKLARVLLFVVVSMLTYFTLLAGVALLALLVLRCYCSPSDSFHRIPSQKIQLRWLCLVSVTVLFSALLHFSASFFIGAFTWGPLILTWFILTMWIWQLVIWNHALDDA